MSKLTTKQQYLNMFNFILGGYKPFKGLSITIQINNTKKDYLGKVLIRKVEDKSVYHIIMHHNVLNLVSKYKDLDYSGYYTYFNALGISEKYYNDALVIRAFIHEMGHIDRYEFFRTKFNIAPFKLFILDSNSINAIRFAATSEESFKQYVDNNTESECYAERFAYRNFPIIWNKLKEKGFIK